jgi:hypothetical protein
VSAGLDALLPWGSGSQRAWWGPAPGGLRKQFRCAGPVAALHQEQRCRRRGSRGCITPRGAVWSRLPLWRRTSSLARDQGAAGGVPEEQRRIGRSGQSRLLQVARCGCASQTSVTAASAASLHLVDTRRNVDGRALVQCGRQYGTQAVTRGGHVFARCEQAPRSPTAVQAGERAHRGQTRGTLASKGPRKRLVSTRPRYPTERKF